MGAYYVIAEGGDREFNLDILPSDLHGQHTHEWHRFVLYGPDFYQVSRIAAHLGWWLHCWDWVEGSSYAVFDRDPPIPWLSWGNFARRSE